MLADVDSAELTEWIAYDRLDPFGEQRADLRSAVIAATVANHAMSPPKKPRKPSDYMLFADIKPKATAAPILLSDPKAQAALIRRKIFGIKD